MAVTKIGIKNASNTYDYTDIADLNTVLTSLYDDGAFIQSVFGKKYIARIRAILGKENTDNSCVLCGKDAENGVVCKTCIEKVDNMNGAGKKQSAPAVQKSVKTGVAKKPATKSLESNIKLEDLLKDMGDDMMQLATENSVRTLKKLTWINIGLVIINSIILIFVAIFLWKFMMAQ